MTAQHEVVRAVINIFQLRVLDIPQQMYGISKPGAPGDSMLDSAQQVNRSIGHIELRFGRLPQKELETRQDGQRVFERRQSTDP